MRVSLCVSFGKLYAGNERAESPAARVESAERQDGLQKVGSVTWSVASVMKQCCDPPSDRTARVISSTSYFASTSC
jgi:hypothetical protein